MKPHYSILDGLRGTAAIMVAIFHLLEPNYAELSQHLMHHGYLAVDFFFMLSGFVIGYAYDDRWGRMSTWDFFKNRLIRLHPLLILAMLVGAIAFCLDPYSYCSQNINVVRLIEATLISFTLLPSLDVRGWGETHTLDGPCWSLLQEYIANILYAIIGRRMNKPTLWAVVILSGIALTWTGIHFNNLGDGWGYHNFWVGDVRMLFAFFAGLLLFRSGKRLHVANAYVVCSLVLIVVFFLPYFNDYNGLFEAACILFIFPVVIAAGAGGQIAGRWAHLCRLSGAISYPLYLLHYQFIYIYGSWLAVKKPSFSQNVAVAVGLFVMFILLAYTVLKLYDEPIRAWLKQKFQQPNKKGQPVVADPLKL